FKIDNMTGRNSASTFSRRPVHSANQPYTFKQQLGSSSVEFTGVGGGVYTNIVRKFSSSPGDKRRNPEPSRSLVSDWETIYNLYPRFPSQSSHPKPFVHVLQSQPKTPASYTKIVASNVPVPLSSLSSSPLPPAVPTVDCLSEDPNLPIQIPDSVSRPLSAKLQAAL
ncbi:hypothetical protein AMTR_s00001p00261550, partial [Amborella trichopoda]